MTAKLTPEELHGMVIAKADSTWLLLQRLYPQIQRTRPLVKYNKRLKTTAGRAFYEASPQYIDLSHDLLWQHHEEMINVVVPHELAHLAAYTVFGDTGHGEGWKIMMGRVGLPPLRCHNMENSLHEARKRARLAK